MSALSIHKSKGFTLITKGCKGFTLMSRARERGFTLISGACKGFTLIEMLVVISIIGVIMAVSLFGLAGVRQDSRDNRRRTDIESIKAGLELYKSDCGDYPATLTFGGSLVGDGTPAALCPATNTYIAKIPADQMAPTRLFSYVRTTAVTYVLCAALETPPSPPQDTTGCGSCGSAGACNYKETNP